MSLSPSIPSTAPPLNSAAPVAMDHTLSPPVSMDLDPHPHFTLLLDRLHALQAAEIQSPHPLADQLADLKRQWTRLALVAQHVPATAAAAARNVPNHGHLSRIPLLASSAAPPLNPRQQEAQEVKAHVEQGLKSDLIAIVEHGLGQEMASDTQLSTSTHRLLDSLASLAPPPTHPTQSPDANDEHQHLAHSLSTTLTYLTSLLTTRASLTQASATSSAYFARVAQVALAKLDLLAATVRAHDAPRTAPLALAVHEALTAKKQALERELAHVRHEVRVYEELGPEFAEMCREIRRTRAEVQRVKTEVDRLKSTATSTTIM